MSRRGPFVPAHQEAMSARTLASASAIDWPSARAASNAAAACCASSSTTVSSTVFCRTVNSARTSLCQLIGTLQYVGRTFRSADRAGPKGPAYVRPESSPQRRPRVNPRRAPRRNGTRDERDDQQCRGDGRERDRIGLGDAEEEPFEKPANPERDAEAGREPHEHHDAALTE